MSGFALDRLAIIGAGAWGTALAIQAQRAGRQVRLWARRPELVAKIRAEGRNADYLPGIALDPAIIVTSDLSDLGAVDAAILACPAQSLRAIAGALAPHWPAGKPICLACKGIERGSLKTLAEVALEALPGRPRAVLSGPTFAAEIAAGLPAAATVAARDEPLGRAFAAALAGPRFRLYWSEDLIGVELGGAIKNVLAIACGIVMGRQLGDNARAALIARGLAEMMRLGVAMGARPETLMGLSGLGDLVLTCTGRRSRNLGFGIGLGEGRSAAALLEGRRDIVEGVFTAEALAELAQRHGVEMPIVEAVDQILNRGAAIDATIVGLLARPPKAESGLDRPTAP